MPDGKRMINLVEMDQKSDVPYSDPYSQANSSNFVQGSGVSNADTMNKINANTV